VELGKLSDVERLMRAAFTLYVKKFGLDLSETSYSWLSASVVAGDVYAGFLENEMISAAVTVRLEYDLYIEASSPFGVGRNVCPLLGVAAHRI
jgi:hypothetical protein